MLWWFFISFKNDLKLESTLSTLFAFAFPFTGAPKKNEKVKNENEKNRETASVCPVTQAGTR